MNSQDTLTVKELIENYSSLLMIDPLNIKALVLRGILRESQKKYELAISDFSALIKAGEKKGYYLRAYSYCKMGNIDLALKDICQAEIQAMQSPAIPQYIAYIVKKRSDIIKEIEAVYLKDRFNENYNNLDHIIAN